MINDKVFGELEYNYGWVRDMTINFFDNEVDITLMISGEEDGKFDKEQYLAFNFFVEKWKLIQEDILQEILCYYIQLRYELGYDKEYNEFYPKMEKKDQLLNNITLVGITITSGGLYDGRDIGITFDCSWDDENGVGIRLVNEKVFKIGYQDVAF